MEAAAFEAGSAFGGAILTVFGGGRSGE